MMDSCFLKKIEAFYSGQCFLSFLMALNIKSNQQHFSLRSVSDGQITTRTVMFMFMIHRG